MDVLLEHSDRDVGPDHNDVEAVERRHVCAKKLLECWKGLLELPEHINATRVVIAH